MGHAIRPRKHTVEEVEFFISIQMEPEEIARTLGAQRASIAKACRAYKREDLAKYMLEEPSRKVAA